MIHYGDMLHVDVSRQTTLMCLLTDWIGKTRRVGADDSVSTDFSVVSDFCAMQALTQVNWCRRTC